MTGDRSAFRALGPSVLRLLGMGLLASGLGACGEDEVVNRNRPAPGGEDAGVGEPIAFSVGQTFTWQAMLTHRGSGAADEGDAIFQLTVTIDAVDDRGLAGASRLTVSATGQNLLDRDWSDIRDFDPWIARLGPARSSDVVDDGSVSFQLDGPPELPGPPMPKQLPAPETLFIDIRDIETIRSDFDAFHEGRNPRIVAPEDSVSGTWQFSYEGPDDRVSSFYPSTGQRREVRLEYDRRGLLQRLSEVVGPASATETPRATGNLNLTAGD